MLMTGNAIRNNVVPIWNEVKNWSREDRANLYELLEVSLNEKQMPNDEVENVLDQIDENLMKQCLELAHQDYLAGRCKTHEQVMAELREKRGWN